MTPHEAVNRVVANGILHADRVQSLASLRTLFDAVQATAKAEERRECAAFTRQWGWHTVADAMLSSAGLGVVDAMATAKEEAAQNETLRCEGVARMQNNSAARDYRNKMFKDAKHPTGKHLCDMIADEILRTGGLEANT